jgi:hypothetical protein
VKQGVGVGRTEHVGMRDQVSDHFLGVCTAIYGEQNFHEQSPLED